MKSLYKFIVRPYEARYDNVKQVDGKELIVNTSIEDYKSISKKAVVVSTPAAFDTDIKTGDKVYIHHNIFRRWYNQKGLEKNGSTYFKDNLYFCDLHQIYMYNDKCHLDYCFVKPVSEKSFLKTNMTTYYRYAIGPTLIFKSDRRPNPYRKRVFSIWGHSLKKEG